MPTNAPIHISLIATPEVDVSALAGMHGVFNAFSHMVPGTISFKADVVMPDSLWQRLQAQGSAFQNVMGLPLPVQRRLSEVEQTDIVIIPSLYLLDPDWPDDPYPDLTQWLLQMHRQNTLLCSACTGAMLLAETGLLNGYEATQHWAFEGLFRQKFPEVQLNINKVLITTGESNRILMSGASAAWHDLLIFLISHYVSPQAAQTIAKFFLLTPHSEGQAPYIIFQENLAHGDTVIVSAQQWLKNHSTQTHPIEEVQQLSGLAPRTFSRRFHQATGLSPVQYLQHLRIEYAKQCLESADTAVDEISWQVGYEDPAFFRRLFKRLTGMTPRAYRRKFHWVGLADSSPGTN